MYRSLDIAVESLSRRNDLLGEGIIDFCRATAQTAARSTAGLHRFMQMEWRRQTWMGTLAALDDRLLEDIGLTRHEIPDYVERHMTARSAVPGRPSPVLSLGRAARETLRRFKTWRRSLTTARQLRSIDDRLLIDIGVNQGDIDGVARDLAKRRVTVPAPANDNRFRVAA